MAIINGDGGNNTLPGTIFDDTINAYGGNDTLEGLGGADRMYGGAGDDIFIYRDGLDGTTGETISGGTGSDRIQIRGTGITDLRDTDILSIEEIEFYADASDSDKTVYLGNVEMDSAAELSPTLLVDGNSSSGSDDTIHVYVNAGPEVDISGWTFTDWNNAANNTDRIRIYGDAAGNTLRGSSQSETAIFGVDGDDTLYGEDGEDSLYGGTGTDTLYGEDGEDSLYGGTGTDTLYGGYDSDLLRGGDEGDTLYGDSGIDTLYGEAGNDTLEGGTSTDEVYGGDGDDLFRVLAGSFYDNVYGGAGTDTLDHSTSTYTGNTFDFEAETITGPGIVGTGALEGIEIYYDGSGGNTIVSDGSGTYYGGSGDDVLESGNGTGETLYGGAGQDTFDNTWWNGSYVYDFGTGATNYVGELFLGFEIARFGNGNDNVTGTAGAETVFGGAGDDWMTLGAGNDRYDGGAGTDMASFVGNSAPVVVNLGAGTATVGGDSNILVDIENISGTIYGDFIEGDGGANRLRGLGGYDWFVGSGGGDTFEGSNGRDMVSYVNAASAVAVDLGAGIGTVGQAAGDIYNSIERVTGSIFSDLFYGSSGEDDFRGLGGYDWFVGSGGGRDRYDGQTGQDTVAYNYSASAITASLLLGSGSTGDAAQDLYTSIENLTGSNHNDVLTGDHGRNVLRGMYGEDTLYGNGGVDHLTGGGSDDVLYGGAGWDTAFYEHNKVDYQVFTAGGQTSVTYLGGGGEGIDLVIDVEVLSFADGLIYL